MTTLSKYALACLLAATVPLWWATRAPAAETAPATGRTAGSASITPDQSSASVTNNGPEDGSFETRPFVFPNNNRGANHPQSREGGFTLPAFLSVFLAICLVCGFFVVALLFAKKYLPGHRQLFSHPAMEVLGRTHLDPKRYVSLVRVGKRIIVLGVTQDEINPLSEITDDAEITSIMEVARPKTEMGLTLFQRLFQRQVLDNEAAENAAMVQAGADTIGEQMTALRERVMAVRGTEETPRRVDAIG